jgi:SAM-dependent methyltransferase
MEFWELSFREKQEMWGMEPADAALVALELFKHNGSKKILIPGFGYGRNAKVFLDNGLDVTGIEISETAIRLANEHYGNNLKIHHGSVCSMPFDSELYDGIFCYALIHLLDAKERTNLIKNCYEQLAHNGLMIFLTISKLDARYGKGKEIRKDTFETAHGVTLFFYDEKSAEQEFGPYGLIHFEEMTEPAATMENRPKQNFCQILCKKNTSP